MSTNDDQQQNNNNQEDKLPDGVTEVFEIHEVDWEALLTAGWSENAIKQAVSCGCIDEDTCLKWLYMHVDHPDLNKALAPHIHVKIKEKFKLTPEQRAAKVAELKARIKAKKEAEQAEKLMSEKDRLEDGRRAREAAEARKQYKREQEERERRKEKEADRIAREKVLLDLEVQRLVRGGLTEEEAKKQALAKIEEQKEKAKQAAAERLAAAEAERKAYEEANAGQNNNNGEKKKWNLAAVLPHTAEDPQQQQSSNTNNNASSSAQQQVMNMFASTSNFYPKEMEDYTPFPDFVPSKKFVKNPPFILPTTTGVPAEEDPSNIIYVPDFSDASPKDVLKTLLVNVKEQVQQQPGTDFKQVFSTLRRILSAVRDNLSEPKIRSLKPSGGLFRSHLSAFPNTLLFLRAVGFQKHLAAAPPPPPQNQQQNQNDDSSSQQQPTPAFELKYCDVAILFASLAALDEVEAEN